jgi:hypothetical protein
MPLRELLAVFYQYSVGDIRGRRSCSCAKIPPELLECFGSGAEAIGNVEDW